MSDETRSNLDLGEFLKEAARAASEQAAFDVLFIAGLPPLLALADEVVQMPLEPLSTDEVGALIRLLLEFKVARALPFDPFRSHESQFVVEIPGIARYRVAVYRQRGTLAAVLRPVWRLLPALDALGIPSQIETFLRRKWGLIVVAGPSAAGKSTTLAAMVEYINQNMTRHIISIENPVEYVHRRAYSIISQRSIPEDTPSYSRAVRGALRQIPDVLVVGDVQDMETAAAALGAAESGHLVIASVHSKDASDAIQRIESFFPSGQRRQVAVQVSNTIVAILVQQLLSRRDEMGRVLATELLIATAGIRHLIRTHQTYRLNTFLQSGRHLGMHTMEDSLVNFARSGTIDYGDALTATADVGLFLNLFRKRVAEAQGRGIGRVSMTRRSSTRPGHGAYGMDVPPEGTIYRTDILNASLEHWSSNGLLRTGDGAIRFNSDPFQPTLYAQITDYSIWLGQRPSFYLSNFVRAIVRAKPEDGPGDRRRREDAPPLRTRMWILVILADNSVYSLPGEDEPGLDIPLDDLWHTFYMPIPPELVGGEVKAYALRFSQPRIEVEVREVLFN